MGALRHWIGTSRRTTWSLIALTLVMRLLVPGGFMPTFAHAGIGLTICDGMGPVAMPHAMTGMTHDRDRPAPARPDMPCPFAGLAMPTLGGADAVQLAIAAVAIVAAGRVATPVFVVRALAHLRPPLRGPPLAA